MTTNLVISGGPLHDFAASTAALVELLAGVGVTSTVSDDPRRALEALAEDRGRWDMVTVNALHCAMGADRHAHLRDRWSFELREHEAVAIDRHVRDGGSLLACHAAAICFDGDPRWTACIGASWDWERSSHPPQSPAVVAVTEAGRLHPITAGVDHFVTDDEVYGFLDVSPDVVPLLTSRHGDTDHPMLWAREVGRGRVVTDLLGHDAAAVTHPEHRSVLTEAARWLTWRT